jgi:site-specific DNA-methyltransferase (cytosine-N4-specific)
MVEKRLEVPEIETRRTLFSCLGRGAPPPDRSSTKVLLPGPISKRIDGNIGTLRSHVRVSTGSQLSLLPHSEKTPEIPLKPEGQIIVGDTLEELKKFPDETFQCCVTSPPYWGLRDYGIPGQIGAEMKLEDYVAKLVQVFHEVKRTLKSDSTFWLNIGDGYTSGGRTWRDSDKKNKGRGMDYRAPTPDGLKPKDLIGVPWRVAFALQADGWYLRSEVIWYKPNAQPESVKDRPTRAHEHVFLFSKNEQYFYDHEAVREKGDNGSPRNLRSVWQVNTEPYAEAHFATFPRALILPCLLAGSKQDSTVLDPFFGSGTVGLVSGALGRKFVGIELNPEYAQLARKRLGW